MVSKFFRGGNTASSGRPILSIRARLVVLALLIVVPLTLDRVRLLEGSRSERIESAVHDLLGLARRGIDGQREIVTSARALLQVVARAYLSTLASGKFCSVYLADLTGNIPWIKSTSIVNDKGRIACSTNPAAIGVDVSDRDYYRDALETRSFVLSNYLVGRVRHAPTIIAVYPTTAINTTLNSVVIASLDLRWFNSLANVVESRPGATMLLMDGTGNVLAREPRGDALVGKDIADSALARAMLSADEGAVRTVGPDGVRGIFAFVRVPDTDARLAVGVNEAETLARVEREILIAYLQLGFFALLVLMMAWFGGERLIVDPIRALSRTAARFGRGDLDVHPDGRRWAKEFEPLALALDDMARKLAERENELRTANRHLEELASIDSLTGLANRRGFDARLNADWQRAGKLGRPVGLLMIDVDNFKLFNDCYGHVEGDVCLRRVAKLLMGVAGGTDDFPARYGGEEFVLLLPGADADTAAEVAERLRSAIENLCIAHAASSSGQVTISVGVASLIPGAGGRPERLIEAADAGLYAAKRRGRNAVVVHGAVTLATAELPQESGTTYGPH
jgi:diguanylate cyclase (GGDEF)-like protein